MPVTAKLSRQFYDTLGEQVTNELVDWFNAVDLTYRTELRQLNDLNQSRFDAKLQEGLVRLGASLTGRFNDRISSLEQAMEERFVALQRDIDTRFGALHREMDTRFGALHHEMDTRFGALRHEMDTKFAALHHELDTRFGASQNETETRFTNLQHDIDGRFAKLEQSIGQLIAAPRAAIEARLVGHEKALDDLRAEMKVRLADQKTDLVKWMFLFWLGSIAAAVVSRMY